MATVTLSVQATYLGERVFNTLHLTDDDPEPITTTQAQAFANLAATNWPATVMGQLHQSYVLNRVTASSPFDPTIYAEAGSSAVGANGGDASPGWVTARVNLSSGLRGRAFNTRTGLTGLPELFTTGNQLASGKPLAIAQEMADFLAAFNAGGTPTEYAAVSTTVGGVPRVTPLVTPCPTISVPVNLGSQVGRKPR